ncbi:carboxylesterase family protein [Lentzea indica]|uniref:carboxylesterase family protein n=1 Tax=Lentzea indica TaxID=2604800 RepID=UPI001CB73821|nr:carboxylesterase family protein [Lentzea indica]
MLINTTAGTLEPEVSEGLVRARGVRYATASRFAEPEPYTWHGVLDATRRGPACPQPPSSLVSVVGSSVEGLVFDEHCQVLSVTAPVGAADLPVMVWFHGGAYVTGSGESTKYDASLLASEGVVVVSVSYRLGVFGYLRDNLGLLDQLVALRWVRDNIAAFGGDPANVTAFGQSAGADSVYALMVATDEVLFHRAILQSAPLGARGPERADMTSACASSSPSTPPRRWTTCWPCRRKSRRWRRGSARPAACRSARSWTRSISPRRLPGSSCSSGTHRTTPARTWLNSLMPGRSRPSSSSPVLPVSWPRTG